MDTTLYPSNCSKAFPGSASPAFGILQLAMYMSAHVQGGKIGPERLRHRIPGFKVVAENLEAGKMMEIGWKIMDDGKSWQIN